MIQKLTILTSLALVIGAAWVAPALGADPDDSLIGHWKLDGDTLDASGLENHGTAVGNPIFETGMYGKAMYFDGDGDYLVLDPVADDFTDDDLTLSAWLKTDDAGTWQWWFSCNTASGGNVIILGLISGNITVHQGAVQVTSTTVVNDLEWRHVAYSRIGSVGSLYIDGVLEGTHTTTFTLSADDLWSIAQEWDSASPGDFLNGTVDDVRIYDRGLTEQELPQIMVVRPGIAAEPSPADGAVDVLRDVVLTWTPGEFAPAVNGHTVYIGDNFSDVNDGIGGVTQSDSTYTPAQRFDFGTTYYWRVDEVNAAPDNTVFTGNVWSFTVEPSTYPIENVTVTSNGSSTPQSGPENLINGSGLNENDEHSTDSDDMWQALPPTDEPLTLEFALDRVYKLDAMEVWNFNVEVELMLGFGLKSVTVDYSADGTTWSTLGDIELAQATADETYTANTSVDFGGAAAQYVRLTVNSGHGSLGQYGLSEVRFLYLPVQPREPEPADGATDVDTDTVLGWRAGREAATHEVYLGTDPSTLSLVDTITTARSVPTDLALDTTYYWQIVEANEAEVLGAWAGDIWSFTTQEYVVVDDFESYADKSPLMIYQTWIDGWGFEGDASLPNGSEGNGSGAQVGYLEAPFAETAVVHGGSQSLPLTYENVGVTYAEAERTFDTPQDWTASGITYLTVHFRGTTENTGQLYLKINDTKIPYDGDVSDIAGVAWQAWNLDLSTLGINLTSVRTLAIGIDGAGATGVLYVDDINLYRTLKLVPQEPDPANLVASYAFDGDVTDGSGNGHDGEANGDFSYVSGIRNQAIEFDGSDDYVRVADHDSLNPREGSFSMTFWAKLDRNPGPAGTAVWDLAIGKRGSSGSIGYYVGANRDQGGSDQAGYKLMLGDTSGLRIDTAYVAVPLDEWVFVAAVVDREQNTHKISVNGGSTWATATMPSNSISVAADLSLGGDLGQNNYWFHGLLDEMRFYNTALTDAEVAWLSAN